MTKGNKNDKNKIKTYTCLIFSVVLLLIHYSLFTIHRLFLVCIPKVLLFTQINVEKYLRDITKSNKRYILM